MPDTNEQVKAYVAGLVEEQGYAAVHLAVAKADPNAHPDVVKAAEARVKDIAVELRRVAGDAKAPAKRAEKRPKKKRESRKKKATAAPAVEVKPPTGLSTHPWRKP